MPRTLFLFFLLSALVFLCGTPVSAQTDPVTCSARDGNCIRIGIFRCDTALCRTATSIVGYQELIDWYINRVNTKLSGRMLGLPVYFVPINQPASAFTSAQIVAGVTTNFIGNVTGRTLVDFVILPAGSNWEAAMSLLEAAKIPSIASNSPLSTLYQCGSTPALYAAQPGCRSINSRRFAYAHGIASSGEQYFQPWVGLLKLKKATSIAVVQTTVVLYQTIKAGVALAAEDFSIPVTYVKTAPLVNGTLVDPDVLNGVIDDLMSIRPDGVVLATQNCVPWIQAFAARDYAPKSLATVLCTDSSTASTTLGNLQNFVVGSAQWSPQMNGNDYIENSDTASWSMFPHISDGQLVGDSSPLQFQAVWREVTGLSTSSPGYAEGAVLAGFTMLEGAINLAGSPDPDLVNQQLQLYYQPSYYGLISTNRYGTNEQKQVVTNQRTADGVLEIVSPTSAATIDFIYPMPVFSERYYEQSMLSTPIEYIVIALIALCGAFTLGLCAYLFHKRNNQVFQAAGLPFYLMMGLGCMVAYCSTLTWGVENNSASCAARIWMWTVGFHMFVDPLLASSWRISRIFSQKLQTVKLTNRMVGAVCCILFAPQLLINILWQSIAPFEATIVTEDELRPAHTSYTTCSGGDNGVIFVAVTLAYSGLLLLAACYLAYRVRRAYRIFNDARPIAMSMYIFTITAAIILVIQIALNNKEVSAQKVLFGLRSIGVLICYQSSLALLYFRRILGQGVEVGKYRPGGGKGVPTDSSVDDTTASGHQMKNMRVEGSTGKMVFQKSNGSGHGNSLGPSSRGDGARNVHMHIQPPVSTNPQSLHDSGTGSPTIPRTSLRGPTGTPSRSAHAASSGVAVSALGLENLSSTPKLGAFGNRNVHRPAQLTNYHHSIITLPPAVPLPTQAEMLAMDSNQLMTLVGQFHAQCQVLRSQIRTQNLANAAHLRGEGGDYASTYVSLLPGTPDGTSRVMHQQGGAETPVEGITRSPSADHIAIHQFGSPPNAVEHNAAIAALTRQNSEAATANVSHNSRISGDSNASNGAGLTPTHGLQGGATLTPQNVEVSPVSEIGPGSLSRAGHL